MNNLVNKLSSRKFWVCVVAFFGSIATSIAALHSQYELVAAIGTAAGIISAAASGVAYVMAEGKVDAAAASATQTINSTSVTATSASAKVVEKAFTTNEQ